MVDSDWDKSGGNRSLISGRDNKNGDEWPIWQDFVTQKIGVIRSDHVYIHKGIAFAAEFADLNLSNDETVNILLTTPTDKYVHFKNIKTVDCLVRVYENPDSVDTTGSTTITPVNQNRIAEVENSKTATTTLSYDVTPTLGSAKLVKSFQEGPTFDTWELDLLQNEQYIIEITNISGAQNNTFFEAFWYEENEVYSG